MIDHLATLLEAFPGSANRTRCFTHILNLVAKCIMKQFDAPKKKKNDGDDSDDEDDGTANLQVAFDELEDELEDEGINEDGNGWEFDMRIELSEKEIEELEETVQPVRRVLTKVNCLSNICFLNNLIDSRSYARPHMLSRTRQPSFFLNGGRFLIEWQQLAKPRTRSHCQSG